MNYRERITSLKQECAELQKKLDKIISDIRELAAEVQRLSGIENALMEKKSSLAKSLLEDVINNISRLNESIANFSAEKLTIENELKKKNKQLEEERETDPGEFIKEQLAKMVPAFWEYVESNKYDIGMNLERTFILREVTVHQTVQQEEYYVDCEVPNGEVEIVDDSTGKQIVKSDEYIFEQELYEIDYHELDGYYCNYSEGFNAYLNMFIRELFLGIVQESQNKAFKVSISPGYMFFVHPTNSQNFVYITLKLL